MPPIIPHVRSLLAALLSVTLIVYLVSSDAEVPIPSDPKASLRSDVHLSPPSPPPTPLSVVIPTWRRAAPLLKQLPIYMAHPRITDIVVSDDYNSTDAAQVRAWLEGGPPGAAKVRVFSAPARLNCMRNKVTALTYARNDWVAVLDSDNFFTPGEFFDPMLAALDAGVPNRTILHASKNSLVEKPWGVDMFAFHRVVTRCGRATFGSEHWEAMMMKCGGSPLLANFNYIVHRASGVDAWTWLLAPDAAGIEPWAFDSLLLNWEFIVGYNGSLIVVSNTTYDHTELNDNPDNLAKVEKERTAVWFNKYAEPLEHGTSTGRAVLCAHVATGCHVPPACTGIVGAAPPVCLK